jgi:8-oxo-dGTP pyrophosphatase MutT (NUDIX family)
MNHNFNSYTKTSNKGTAKFTFIPSTKLPEDLPISTPINFVYVGTEVILALDKDNQWNAVCGKVEKDETWREAIIRETYEEVGVIVEDHAIYLCGYILCENSGDKTFPEKSVLPVCYSFFSKVDYDWIPKETLGREIFRHASVKKRLSERKDESQLLDIYKYVNKEKDNDLAVEFSFIPDVLLDNVAVTSAMTFCLDDDNKVCIVKDGDENFYSLPGGGKEILETPEQCAMRELSEEAQIVGKDPKVFGTILVKLVKNKVVVSQMQQSRYVCKISKMEDFIPYKDGFETDERKFVSIDDLISLVDQLQNENGQTIINHLRSLV